MRAYEDPELLARLVDENIAFEVCPASNVSLGVFQNLDEVPLRTMFDAGATIALGADDPLLFRSRLLDQYEFARAAGFSDSELASLARSSIEASLASPTNKARWKGEIDQWLHGPDDAAAPDDCTGDAFQR